MSVFGGFQLPSLKSDTPSFPQIDEDDDDGNEEAQVWWNFLMFKLLRSQSLSILFFFS
jgi:hypothetical protein